MNLILFGPPGAGKGTQGQLLAEAHGLKKISTGDLLREAVRAGTQLGTEAKRFMDAGELVPDSVILGLVREYLGGDAGAGFILDGFPRTIAQAEGLDRMLAELHQPINAVLVLDVEDEILVKRLSGRRSCPNCGAVYNVYFDAPKIDGRCDRCDSELVHRVDDDASTVRRRLQVYRDQTAPLIEYYQRGRTSPVHTLDGDRSIDEVQAEIKGVLQL